MVLRRSRLREEAKRTHQLSVPINSELFLLRSTIAIVLLTRKSKQAPRYTCQCSTRVPMKAYIFVTGHLTDVNKRDVSALFIYSISELKGRGRGYRNTMKSFYRYVRQNQLESLPASYVVFAQVIRCAESEPESESESPAVVAASKESESESEPIKLP